MNQFERQMVAILKELKVRHGALSVRAEFESEGARMEELMRLKEVSAKAGLGLTLIIGGCEALRDLIESRAVGVNTLAAPMIESDYALQKYLQAVRKVFRTEELEDLEVNANIESVTGVRKLATILGERRHGSLQGLAGITLGRVGLCFSQGMDADAINAPEINAQVRSSLALARAQGLKTTVSGGVSADSLPFFRALEPGLLTRFETRKVVFDAATALEGDPERGILAALAFELFYLKNKMTFFRTIKASDLARMNHLEQIYWRAIAHTVPAGDPA